MKKQGSSTPTKRTIAARQNGSLGGEERARRFADQPEVLAEWSSWGGKAILKKYGPEHFVKIRQLRQDYPSRTNITFPAPPLRRSIVAAINGRKGGRARAQWYGAEHRREWGRLGGLATKNRHGSEFFREIRKKRTTYYKGYMTTKTKTRLHKEALEHAKAEKNWAITELWKAIAREWEN